MKKFSIFCMLIFLTSGMLYGQEKSKNIVGFSAGIVPGTGQMYFGSPWDFSPNREFSPVIQLFYARQLHKAIRFGGFIELEKVRFTDQTGINPHSFRRNNIGVNCLGQFPQTKLHMQLGGYLGYGYLRANHWNDLTGLDVGFIAGPAYEKDHIGVALHLQSGYAGYESSGTPARVKLYNPKILLKIYLKF